MLKPFRGASLKLKTLLFDFDFSTIKQKISKADLKFPQVFAIE